MAGKSGTSQVRRITADGEHWTWDLSGLDVLGVLASIEMSFDGTVAADGTAGGGMVTVTLTGKGVLQAVKIDPSMFKEDDVEILEDLIIAAHNDAKGKIEAIVAEKTQEMTAGLPIPPGMKLPF